MRNPLEDLLEMLNKFEPKMTLMVSSKVASLLRLRGMHVCGQECAPHMLDAITVEEHFTLPDNFAIHTTADPLLAEGRTKVLIVEGLE